MSTGRARRGSWVDMRRAPLVGLVLLAACGGTRAPAAPAAPSSPLRDTIAREDRRLEDAYNAHDADRLMAVFAPDLEFFHDSDGLAGYTEVSNSFHGVFKNNADIRRELVGDIEVYPLEGIGAIQIGAHRFCHTEHGKPSCGTFRFVHLWRQAAGAWQIFRVVSYGH